MKRVKSANQAVVAVLVLGVFCSAGYGAPWAGSGDVNDPYQIWDANDMQAIGASSSYWGAHFLLCADIDLGAYTGTSFNIIGNSSNPFYGVFDGDGHVISNFTYDSTGVKYTGLFGYIDDPNAEVKNLGLIAPDVNAGSGDYVGSLVGYFVHGTISGCYLEGGSVSGWYYVGGLVGDNRGYIFNSYSTGNVTGGKIVGGLVGGGGSISNCYSTGSVTGERYVGGLVGGGGSISNCYSTGSVTGQGSYIGGLVGGDGSISNCYSTGSVTGQGSYVGGLVGYIRHAVSESSSAGSVTGGGNNIGGLVGYSMGGDIQESYSTGEITGGGVCVGGLVGRNVQSCIERSYSTGNVWGGGDCVGGLVGYNSWGDIYNCYTTSSVDGLAGYVGRLVGKNYYGDIQWCYSTGDVTGEYRVGGLVGSNNGGDIRRCYSAGRIEGKDGVGGLVGRNGGDIQESYSTGNVLGGWDVGGLVGTNMYGGYIRMSYSAGSVTGVGGVGGLAGWNYHGYIKESYSSGSVAGVEYVGGLVGTTDRGYIKESYSTGVVTGEDRVGGLVGYDYDYPPSNYTACFWDSDVNPDVNGIGNIDDPNVVELTTVLMQTESTFTDAGWDFVGEVINGTEDIWQMCELPDYPKLWWQECPIELEMEVSPAMLNCDSEGNFVKAHFVLPEGYLPGDVDINTPAVAEPVGVESEWIEVLEEGDGYYGIVAVFDREGFCEALGEETEKYLEVTVKGCFIDGLEFFGRDTISLKSELWRHRERLAGDGSLVVSD